MQLKTTVFGRFGHVSTAAGPGPVKHLVRRSSRGHMRVTCRSDTWHTAELTSLLRRRRDGASPRSRRGA